MPHLSAPVVPLGLENPASPHEQLAFWLAARAELLTRQLARQQETLLAIAEVAGRLNGGAQKLHRQAVAVKRRVVRERLRRYFQERKWKP